MTSKGGARAGGAASPAAVGFIALLCALAPRAVHAQAACKPPKNLRVCQDSYGPKGRAFVAWTNGETNYTRVRMFLDGAFAGDGQGTATFGYISDIAPGSHEFAVEGECGAVTSARTSMSYAILDSTPYLKPIESIQCTFEPALERLTVTWVLSSTPCLFIDVYYRRAGAGGSTYITTLAGDVTSFRVDGALESDRVFLQFFSAACYGSALVTCPGPTCPPPAEVRVCQDIYGQASRVFVAWLPGAADYTGFEVLVDGVPAGQTGGRRGLFYVEPLAPGSHVFGVRGICGSDVSDLVTRTFEVLAASPHTDPARNLHCSHDAARKTLTAAWLPGAVASDFIDVYLRHRGVSLLEFVGTIAGDSTRLTIDQAEATDQAVLQFFSAACYGSPLITCDEEPGTRDFLRGDSDGSARLELTDAIFTLSFLFLGGSAPTCLDACDSNDDGRVDVADPIFDLSYLFTGGAEPPPPGPQVCGADPTPDSLAPCVTGACP